MFKASLPFRQTGRFSDLIIDYLSRSEKTQPFYHRFPELSAFKEQMAEKQNAFKHRSELVQALRKQYSGFESPDDLIARLESDRCFTVTTGHQLCLFTGPLYFIYKIVTTVRLAEELCAAYPESDFVPVFWMASEDHDFDEINHAHVRGSKVLWESGQGGAVGRMSLQAIDEALAEMAALLGDSPFAQSALEVLRKAYGDESENLASATRNLVHAIFGHERLLVMDGDDPQLKKLFIPVVQRELDENFSFKAVESTSAALAAYYPTQVTPREINLFYLGDQLRERIVADEEGFKVLHTDIRFTREEITAELHAHPERFSPNVILRPLYQEVILPNLAYIGGGGELAYWFQLKSMFSEAQVPFPMLVLRNSVMWLSAADARKMAQLNLQPEMLFGDREHLIQQIVRGKTEQEIALDKEQELLKAMYAEISERAANIDPTLRKMILAEGARTAKSLVRIEKRMVRAAKEKHSLSVNRLNVLFDNLFPGNGLQERRANYFEFYERYGDTFLKELFESLNPLDFQFSIFAEEAAKK